MSKSSFLNDNEIEILENINKLRSSPDSFKANFNIVSRALSKIPGKKLLGEELSIFSKSLDSKKPISKVEISRGLCSAAKEILNKAETIFSAHTKVTSENLSSICSKYVVGYSKLVKVGDQGDLDNILIRCIISDDDPKRQYKEAIFNEDFNFCGISSKMINDDLSTIIIFANDITQELSNFEHDPKDYSELKEAFDLFDICHIGRINCNEIKKTMIDLGFIHKSPVIYNIIDKMDDPNNLIGSTFNEFIEAILNTLNVESEEGLKQIFDLYKDDAYTETISLRGMKKMAFELNEKDLFAEISGLIKLANTDGITLTFEEFKQYYLQEDEVEIIS